MGKKDKSEKKAAGEEEPKAELSYDDKKKFCSVIANPLADEKFCKKVLKLAKKAAKRKQLKRGVKEVVKALRKNVKGCVTVRHCNWKEPASLSCAHKQQEGGTCTSDVSATAAAAPLQLPHV